MACPVGAPIDSVRCNCQAAASREFPYTPRSQNLFSMSSTMTQAEMDPDEGPGSLPFSKRAARRMIQRAFVLTGRDKTVRQHIREVHLTTSWLLEDWHFSWTVIVDRGRISFERRPARQPDLRLSWRTAKAFFNRAETSEIPVEDVVLEGERTPRRSFEPVLKGFFESLGHVLRNPVDEEGESLM